MTFLPVAATPECLHLVKGYLTIEMDHLWRDSLGFYAFMQLIQQIFDFLDAGDI